MALKLLNRVVPLKNDKAVVKDLGIRNRSKIYLEHTNVTINEEDNSSDEEEIKSNGVESKTITAEDASLKLSGTSNPKYFLKLGIMKKQMTSGLEGGHSDEVAEVIQELIEKIKLD